MKRIFTLVFCLYAALGQTQTDWKLLEQPSIKLRYLIPKGWYIGGYKSELKCECTGAAVNTSTSGGLNMVIFYSDKQNLDSLCRQSVWGYTFDTENIQDMRGGNDVGFAFTRQLSVWKEDASLRVMRLKAQSGANSYLVYFWGTADVLEQHSADIQKIVQSMAVYTP